MINIEKQFNNYYRQSHRLKGFDYSKNGCYYVTICTKNREHYFGEIDDNVMKYDILGEVAIKLWLAIPAHYHYVLLDEFVVMPNHIHGILMINRNVKNNVATQHIASLQFKRQTLRHYNKFAPQSDNLAAIIRGYKIGVKKFAVINDLDFWWQSRFYDKIIRNKDDLSRIREYIKNNPAN